MTAGARERLEAIREFADLGAGLRLALRDLEIRGAGNLLGEEQHGFIAEVGFELYCQMLEETIRRLQGEKATAEADVEEVLPEVDLPVSAHLPQDYIPDLGMRLDFYRRLVLARTPEEVEALEGELRDRFGRLPLPAQNLLRLARLRTWAAASGVRRISVRDGELVMEFEPTRAPGPEALRGLARHLQKVGRRRGGWRMRLSPERLRAPLRVGTAAQILRDAEELMRRWREVHDASKQEVPCGEVARPR
jgi:transcription-repair coupling factor (superfamily II helicase)